MSNSVYYAVALVGVAALAWQLIGGVASGAWWLSRATRADTPGAYWLLLAAQAAILVAFLITAKARHVR